MVSSTRMSGRRRAIRCAASSTWDTWESDIHLIYI
jgi:hypothetical protein